MDIFKKRKKLRLENYDYSLPGAYYVTICTKDRKNVFWSGDIDLDSFSWYPVGANCVRPKNLPLSDAGRVVCEELERWDKTYENVSLHSYVIMPNHLHIMVVITNGDDGRTQFAPTLERMVKQFKGAVTKKIGESVWQRSYIEHIIRNRTDYEIKSNYIYENPTRWKFDELY